MTWIANVWRRGRLLGLILLITLIAINLAIQDFVQVPISLFSSAPILICKELQEARGQARWDAPGRGGYLYGNGSLLLQQCARGTWTLDVNATPMSGEPPRLLVTRGGEQIFDRDVNGTYTQRIQTEAGQAVVLVAPNTKVILEDRNLYVRQFIFTPDVPCLQNPATLSSNDVGSSAYGQFDLLSNGSVLLTACGQGQVSFRLSGSEAAGIGPLAQVLIENRTKFLSIIKAASPQNLKFRVLKGQILKITFSNDAARQIDQRLVEIKSAIFTKVP